MRRIRLAALLLFAPLAWGNACATASSSTPGNWSDPAMWTSCGGVTPGNGDTFLITRPITMDVNVTVGTSPADTVTTLTGATGEVRKNSGTTYGSLTVAAGVTFTMRGSLALTPGSGTWRPDLTFQAGSTFILDGSQAASPSTAVYRIYNGNRSYVARVHVNGTAQAHVTFRGKPTDCANCANGVFYDSWPAANNQQTYMFDASYVDFYDGGCATCNSGGKKDALMAGLVADDADGIFRLQHARFYRCSGIGRNGNYNAPNTGGTVYVLNDVRSYNSLAPFLAVGSAVAKTTGTRTITDCYFDTGIDATYTQMVGFTIDHTVFDGDVWSTVGSTAPADYISNSLVRIVSWGPSTSVNFPWGEQKNTYYYITTAPAPNNSQGIRWGAAGGSPAITVDGMVYEFGDKRQQEGSVGGHYGMPAGGKITIKNSIILPTAQDKSIPGADFNVTGALSTAGQFAYLHNTYLFSTAHYLAGSVYSGEQSVGVTGAATVQSSIFYNLGAQGASGSKINPITTENTYAATHAIDHFSALDHNNIWRAAAVTRWTSGFNAACTPCTSNGTPYDTPTKSYTPGAGDVLADPKFVWAVNGRVAPGIREWALLKHAVPYPGGSIDASTDATDAFALFGATADATTLEALIDEAFAYIRSEWAPTNTALKGAAHDGTDIGAFPVAASKKRRFLGLGVGR